MFFCMGLIYALVSYAITVKDCGVGKSLFNVNHLAISPTNPIAGQNVTLDYVMNLSGNGVYITATLFLPALLLQMA